MLHRFMRRPSPSMVVATLALFVALNGPAAAAHFINGATIKRNSIGNQQIRNGTLGVADLSAKALKLLRTTPPLSVGTAQLQPSAVTTDKLADGSVSSAKIADRSIQAVDLADGSVGGSALAPGAVTASKIGDSSIGSSAVADGSLRANDIADFYGAVSVDFLPFAPNTCQVAKDIAPQPSAPGAGASIADDTISVSPVAGWPDPIVVTANPGANNTLRIVACRVGADPSDVLTGTPSPIYDPNDLIDPPATTFHYIGFDQP